MQIETCAKHGNFKINSRRFINMRWVILKIKSQNSIYHFHFLTLNTV